MYSTQKNIIFSHSISSEVLTLRDKVGRVAEGGLRLQGKHKSTTANTPLLSVITVVFNGESFIEETILSVLNQTYDNIEYIIIDAGSTDGTVDIIRKYGYAIDYWVSEADQGIYDAMNKGASVSHGRYLHFLNAGDSYYEKEVLEKVHPVLRLRYLIVIGAAELVYSDSHRVIRSARLKRFQMPNCHQSCFYLTSEFKKKYFSTEYKIVADFNHWFDVFVLDGAKVTIIDDVVCCYDMNGISSIEITKSFKEILKVFYLTPQWRFKILGVIAVMYTLLRVTVSQVLQRAGMKVVLLRLKLKCNRH